jgi:hypothetical protein
MMLLVAIVYEALAVGAVVFFGLAAAASMCIFKSGRTLGRRMLISVLGAAIGLGLVQSLATVLALLLLLLAWLLMRLAGRDELPGMALLGAVMAVAIAAIVGAVGGVSLGWRVSGGVPTSKAIAETWPLRWRRGRSLKR